jgi:hypothetical protein
MAGMFIKMMHTCCLTLWTQLKNKNEINSVLSRAKLRVFAPDVQYFYIAGREIAARP